LNTKIVKDTNK